MDPHFRAMLDADAEAAAARNLPALGMLPAAPIRAGYQTQRRALSRNAPAEVATRDLLVSGADGDIAARLYEPPGCDLTGPGLVFFHGGGFVIGDLETHDGFCRHLSALSRCRVLAVDYRLAPEHPFPAAHDDALAAVRWAFAHADEIGFAVSRIAVGGDSAGANLATSIAIDLKDDPAHRPAFQLLLYPAIWPDEQTGSRAALDGPIVTKAAMRWFEASYAAAGHPEVARVHLGSDVLLDGMPPAYIVTAGFDPLKDEGRDYAARLAAAGVAVDHVEYPSMIHDFLTMPDVSPVVVGATRAAAEAMRDALARTDLR
ncbi:alpha/beta hydrolase [Sphingomonas bacterium]|uniref:alpha/beta hydrolase n=1 Tax=Sphingomonas bacterium TaxID=1895847 RepID=UPI0015764DE0|nr:alpha/beta hydrolase [Sphingomonas bacterium]